MQPVDSTTNAYAHLNAGLSAAAQPHIHPLALALGIAGFFCLLFLVSASSYQKHQLQVLARKLLRKKRKSVFEEDLPAHKQDTSTTSTTTTSTTAHYKNSNSTNTSHGDAILPSFVRQAAASGNARVLKRWIDSPSRFLDAASAENLSALHYAARSGHNECARLLLAARADPNVADERRVTPLHLAALGGHALCVKLLLDHDADPFVDDVDDHAPLFLAEQSGHVGCARLLQRAMARAALQDGDASSVTLRQGATTTRLDNAV